VLPNPGQEIQWSEVPSTVKPHPWVTVLEKSEKSCRCLRYFSQFHNHTMWDAGALEEFITAVPE